MICDIVPIIEPSNSHIIYFNEQLDYIPIVITSFIDKMGSVLLSCVTKVTNTYFIVLLERESSGILQWIASSCDNIYGVKFDSLTYIMNRLSSVCNVKYRNTAEYIIGNCYGVTDDDDIIPIPCYIDSNYDTLLFATNFKFHFKKFHFNLLCVNPNYMLNKFLGGEINTKFGSNLSLPQLGNYCVCFTNANHNLIPIPSAPKILDDFTCDLLVQYYGPCIVKYLVFYPE